MALNRNNTFNPNDTSWMDAGSDPSERGFVSKSLRFIFGTAKGVVVGAAEGAWNKLKEDHLDNISDAKEIFDDFHSATEKATEELGSSLKEFKSAAKEIGLKYTEGLSDVMPSSVYRRLSRAFEEPEDDSYSPGDSVESSITSNLASIFNAQAKHNAQLHHISMKSAATDRALASKYHAQDIAIAVASSRSADNIDTFLRSTYVNYLKKDLELKYRNLHLMKTLSSNVDSIKSEFGENGVIGKMLHNTNPLGQTVAEHDRITTSSYQKNFFTETLDNMLSVPTTTLSMLSGIMSAYASLPFNGISEVVASAMKVSSPWLFKKIGKHFLSDAVQKKIEKKWDRAKIGLDLLNGDFGAIKKMSSMKLNGMARKLQNSDNWLLQMIGNMMPTFERNTNIANLAATNPKDAAIFDNLTRETIVTIIPEHLSRIGDHIEALAKLQGVKIDRGNSKVWDVRARSFITRADQRRRNVETMYGNEEERKRRYQGNVDTFIDLTGTGSIDYNNVLSGSSVRGKSSLVMNTQRDMVQYYQKELSRFIENSAYYNLELDIDALLACSNNDVGVEYEDYLNKVFGTIDSSAINTSRIILQLVSRFDSHDNIRDIDHVLVGHINERISNQAKELDVVDDIRQQLLDQNLYDHEDYKFNLHGNGKIRTKSFLNEFDKDHDFSGDINVTDRFNKRVYEDQDETIDKLDKKSLNYYKLSRMFSKNARERLLHDKIALTTGFSAAGLIPGSILSLANKGYNYLSEKMGLTSGLISDFIDNNELLSNIKANALKNSTNLVISISPVKRDQANSKLMHFKIFVKMVKTGSNLIEDRDYSCIITQAEWDNFTIDVDGKPNSTLKAFTDKLIDNLGKDGFSIDWKHLKLNRWPDSEVEVDKYDFKDIIYSTNKEKKVTQSQSILTKYLDSIDRSVIDLRNYIVPASVSPKRVSIHDRIVNAATAKLRKLVNRKPQASTDSTTNSFVNPLGDPVKYDAILTDLAGKEVKTEDDTNEYAEIFSDAISEFEDAALKYCLTSMYNKDDEYIVEKIEEEYEFNVLSYRSQPRPKFNYEDPVVSAKANNKSVKNPYGPLNDWLKSKGSAASVSSNRNRLSLTFLECVAEVEHIVFAEARIKAFKILDKLQGPGNTETPANLKNDKPMTVEQRTLLLGKQLGQYSVTKAKLSVPTGFYEDFDRIIREEQQDALKYAAYEFYTQYIKGNIRISEIDAAKHASNVIYELSQKPGFISVFVPFAMRVPESRKSDLSFVKRMTSWISQNSDNEVKPIVTQNNFNEGAKAIDDIIAFKAQVELMQKYISFNEPQKLKEKVKQIAVDGNQVAQSFKGYVAKAKSNEPTTNIGKAIKFILKKFGVKDTTGYQVGLSDKSVGLTGDTAIGNVITSAAQKLGKDGWFTNSETYNINPSDKGISLKPTINAGKVLSSSYADGSFGRATLHAEGGMFDKIKKAKMFSAVTNWIKVIQNKKDNTNIVAEERKLEKAGFNPKDLLVPATLAVMADKLDVGNALDAVSGGGGGTTIFGIPTGILNRIKHGLWMGTRWVGTKLWHGTKWLGSKTLSGAKWVGRNVLKTPKLIGPATAALIGGAMGFGGSRSSNASWTSTAVSTAAGIGAGAFMYANIWNPIGWTLAGIMAINAAREGWVDQAHLKTTWGAIHRATAAQKGASALGNILNYLTFGILKSSGVQKYVDKAIYNSGVGNVAGGIGETVAGMYNTVNPSNRSEDDPLSDEQLMRARAALKTDIERGEKDAVERLRKFEQAVKAGDWRTARQISGIHRQTPNDASKESTNQIIRGVKRTFGLIKDSPDELPMTDDEKKIGRQALEYAAMKDPAHKEMLYNYKELVATERWLEARKVVREVLESRAKAGDLKSSMYLEDFNSFTNTNEKDAQAKLKELRDEAYLNGLRGTKLKDNTKLLTELNHAIEGDYTDYDNPNSYFALTGIEDTSQESLEAKLKLAQIPKDKLIKARQELSRRYKEDGNQAAGPMLVRLDDAIKHERWNEVRSIISAAEIDVEDQSDYSGGLWGWWMHKLGDNQKYPMSNTEIMNTENKLNTQYEETGDPRILDRLNEFRKACRDKNWKRAREISGYLYTRTGSGDILHSEQTSDRKMTSVTNLAKRYRLLHDRALMAWRNVPSKEKSDGKYIFTDHPVLAFVKELEKLDLAELTPKKLDALEARLLSLDSNIGPMTEQDVANFERERLDKQALLTQRDNLLREIATSQKRFKQDDWKQGELKRLFNEIQYLSQSELTQGLLDGYDKYLKTLDSEALSTKVYSFEMREKLANARIRRNTLIGNIEDAISKTKSIEKIKALKELKSDVIAADLENLVDGTMFATWDKELKSINPASISSEKRTEAELNKLRDTSYHQESLIRMIEGLRNKYNLPKDVDKSLGDMIEEIANKAPDEVTDDTFKEWTTRVNNTFNTDITKETIVEESKEHDALIRKKSELQGLFSSKLYEVELKTRYGKYKGKYTDLHTKYIRLYDKHFVKNVIPNDKLTKADVDAIEVDYNNLVNEYNKLENDLAQMKSGAVEQAVSLDRNGNVVDSQSGSPTSVSLKTAPGGQIIHTHPDGSPTSATDIAAAIQNDQTAVTTLRSSGKVLGYSGQNTKEPIKETVSVKKTQHDGVDLTKSLNDMSKGITDGINGIDTNRDVLIGIYERLSDVIDAVSEHNTNIKDRIDISALQSYDLARKFTLRMTQKVKNTPSVFRPSVINISK